MSSPKRRRKEDANPFTGKPYSGKHSKLLATRQTLPIWEYRDALLKLVSKHQTVIVQGDTGSGKTTQLGQFLAEAGYAEKGVIGITQPRRVAAMSIAARVADEMDVELGQYVGYLIRFEDMTTEGVTKVKFMTDGMLLRECLTSSQMDSYQVVILDEAHERTISSDVLFGLLKQVLEKRADMKCIIASATLDTEKFAAYFDGAPLLQVSGRMYPVEVFYSIGPTKDYVECAIQTAVNIHLYESEGDILIFLTGEDEIETACSEIPYRCQDKAGMKLNVLPLYSALPPSAQRKVFSPTVEGTRKVVIATNIAETSLTIDGIVFVVDPGFTKQKVYNPRTTVESLLVAPISRASAAQRSGRAGRTRPGKCFRLYTGPAHDKELLDMSFPEILRTNLQSTVLTLLRLGITDLVHFDFMDPPSPETLMRSIEALHYLGAVGEDFGLTPRGEQMADLPLEPPLAAMLLSSHDFECTEQMLTIVAMLSSQPPFMRPRQNAKAADFVHRQFAAAQDGDHVTLLNAYAAYEENGKKQDWCWENYLQHRSLKSAESVRRQLERHIKKVLGEKLTSTPQDSPHFSERVRRTLVSGLFMQAAMVDDSGKVYRTLRDSQYVAIHPGSVLKHKPEFVVYQELAVTEKSFMRTVTSVWTEWLLAANPAYFESQEWPQAVEQAFEKARKRAAKADAAKAKKR